MAKPLVIVESPAKVKTISRILGPNYNVKASWGHVRDLPVRGLGVDIENRFQPHYVLVPKKSKVVNDLKKAARECRTVYLAPDPDREGEAIAWHLKELLQPAGAERFLRVRFNEITPTAVREAFAHPGEIDPRLVGAQQARRVLDRLVGYTVSPLLWKRIQTRLSAGRVQSVALRLVCEREEEIRRFVPEPYWVVGARVRKQRPPLDPFRIRLLRIGEDKADIRTEDRARAVMADLDGRRLRVADIVRKEVVRRAPPPFMTSSLQQAASSALGFSAKRTMELAQRLYEGVDLGEGPVGLITYMRTDSLAVARDAQETCRHFIRERFGEAYCPPQPNAFKNRSSAQAAHEAIRPTDVLRTPDALAGKLDRAQWRLYDLIWKRFVASQMSPARLLQRTVKIEAVPEEARPTRYLFHATDTSVLFPGYLVATGQDATRQPDAKNSEEDKNPVPELDVGEELDCLEWLLERKETQPPPRYSESALIGVLESKGIGRPSTYAQILSTLVDRKYVRSEKRILTPTELGERVNRLLVGMLPNLFDVAFTALMEEQLDAVEQGRVEWTTMLEEFHRQFRGWMSRAVEPTAPPEQIAKLLDALQSVERWEEPARHGRRTFSDREFVASIRRQVEEGHKPITQRQLDVLLQIAWHYRDQNPALAQAVADLGATEAVRQTERRPPTDRTRRKLEILRNLKLGTSSTRFLQSLEKRVAAGRDLTPAQTRVLDEMIAAHGRDLPDFDRLRQELDITLPAPSAGGVERRLLEALGQVKEWKPAVQKGDRTFDDQAFYRSLADQFGKKGSLSPRQTMFLRRLVQRYRRQIPEYEKLIETTREDSASAPSPTAGQTDADAGQQ